MTSISGKTGEKAAEIFLLTGRCAVNSKYTFRTAKKILCQRHNIKTKPLGKDTPPLHFRG